MSSQKIPNWVIIAFIIVSIIGFADAAYLTMQHYAGEVPNCSVLKGCETVTTSKYSTVAGFPIALLGAGYYLTALFISIAYIDMRKNQMAFLLSFLTLIGFLISTILVFLQLFVLNAICLYCMISAATSTILFALGVYMFFELKKRDDE